LETELDVQLIIVFLVIAASIAFAGVTFARKTKTFSTKNDCAADCGCGDSKDQLTSSKV
jgi:hypothetical protein